MTEKQIDLRDVLPMDRHRTVFRTFDELTTGKSFTLVVDHDPKPLFYQFESQRPGVFSWNYSEQGPKVWKVRIEKTKEFGGSSNEKEEGCCGICGD